MTEFWHPTVTLRKSNVVLPPQVKDGKTGEWVDDPDAWGEFRLRWAAPHAGSEWTDDGKPRDDKGLKHRAKTSTRRVPITPELVAILRAHMLRFPPDGDGRVFSGERGGDLPAITYNRVWARARGAVFTPDVLDSPLAKTPYDLRHACVSTWLAGGVPSAKVAAWAGHSVEVLHKVYAKFLDGHEVEARRRAAEALK